ncbi:hypothetical protein AVEN_25588-1 [Araneus ventricosus]|uniref:Uncharacterized protein n=1 Tax=Araneus ventricosus TaxID=182803 RepID=A0A4Y2VSB7_ARAVE|nr:hypothetical protein AVEN_25588-1 [Araneus ventricosus]
MGLQWPGGKISTSGHAGSTFETRMYQRRADLMVWAWCLPDLTSETQTSSCWRGEEVWKDSASSGSVLAN